MATRKTALRALRAAFPYTIPILAGFLFLGVAYGVYASASGFSGLYATLMSVSIFAGSMEFVTVDLLRGAFDPLGAFLLTLMVNARHLFYGLSMLEKYTPDLGRKRWYMVFGMCDESFSINCMCEVPPEIDRGWFYFFVTLLNQLYWVTGATLGGLFGSFVPFSTEGLSFVMTALFLVIFLESWLKERDHTASVVGVLAAVACLVLIGADNFMLPAMLLIFVLLTALRKPIERKEGAA